MAPLANGWIGRRPDRGVIIVSVFDCHGSRQYKWERTELPRPVRLPVRGAYDGGPVTAPTPFAPPVSGDTWVGLSASTLPVEQASAWVVRPDCGAVVVFSGTARDHSDGRSEVDRLEYEAYEEQVVVRLGAIADAARTSWPDLGRIVLIHRVGLVPITESAVIVAVSAPHRDAAFEAARFGIDTIKATVPIWKKERWADGESWGLEAQHLVEVDDVHRAGGDGPVEGSRR